MKKYFLSILALILLQNTFAQSPRTILNFNSGWKFYLGNDSAAILPSYNDAAWRTLDLPHDWSIESNFIKDAPATTQGGALPGGIGWYRKTFTLPPSAKGKNITIVFDGVYKNSEVWINGHYLGKRPYGYINFSYDLTPWLLSGQQNVITVKVDNRLQPDSRWYTGSGIYRDVKLVIRNPVYIDDNYAFISSELYSTKKDSGFAVRWTADNPNPIAVGLQVRFGSIENTTGIKQALELAYTVLDRENKPVYKSGRHALELNKQSGAVVGYDNTDGLHFKNPVLWSVDHPYLYKVVFSLYKDGQLVDEVVKNTGIRRIYFDSDKGFFLNDRPLKIHGVCLHHDLGALGAAFNKAAAKRQLTILKEMGCNAIRFSHNPPASAMLDLCDEMGFLVVDEAYDIWKKKKNKHDYHVYFDEWGIEDVQAMVRRDRNHPSVMMWSIGNEQREQFDSTGTSIVKKLVAAAKEVDPTRPVTTALTETLPEKNFITKAGALDVLGFNYKLYDYEALPQRFPGQKFIATETASALETRGVYHSGSGSIRIWPPDYKAQDTFSNVNGHQDYTAEAYDNTHAYWGATHEKSWLAVKRHAHMSGLFVWSGFDYLGEPLPYAKFPARSSYYGIIDLAGFPKDVYYMYQSEWTNKPVLHLFPHWNTAANGGTGWHQGDTVDVWAYYNLADEVELFLNGRSMGKRTKSDSSLHVMWRVPYEPGILKAVSRKNQQTVLVQTIKTAGPAAKLQLVADKKKLATDGTDLGFITVKITDKDGNLVTESDRELLFSVKGAGILAGTDNGYQADTVSLKSPVRKSWKGLALAIVQAGKKKGNITVMVKTAGLKPAVISLVTGE